MSRVSWDEYFLQIAYQVSKRATCDRARIGAVIVRDRTILSTGYNGSINGTSHCDDAGHLMENSHCVRTIHAEANAIVQAAKNGISINRAELYTTHLPCWNCFKLVANAGVKRIVFSEYYRPDRKMVSHARIAGIKIVHYNLNTKTITDFIDELESNPNLKKIVE